MCNKIQASRSGGRPSQKKKLMAVEHVEQTEYVVGVWRALNLLTLSTNL